nr:hypothetical protein CIT39_23005 [Bradyrhizobium symbiodeficiens]QDF39603.1 ATP-binding cassette domain-containing protein [Bradyrhizobium symbiodeficiens]
MARSSPSRRAVSRSARQSPCDRSGRRGNQTRSASARTSCFRGRAHPLAGRPYRHRRRDGQHHPGRARPIVGDTGRGKSTLFRAVAGLWPWGSGTILTPAPEAMSFLPQRPYLPLGTLRNALSYPSPADAFLDADVRQALERCDLGDLIPKLDKTERWDKELSLGEQERLAFARLLLHKPGWVFLDEATAALDEDSQRRVMRLFDDELKRTTVLSIGHRPDLAVYHTRTLQLVHGRDGDRLKLKPPPAPPPPRRWLQRLDDWLLTIRT